MIGRRKAGIAIPGLVTVVEWQIATAILVAVLVGAFVPVHYRRDCLASIAAVVVAMLIGFMPLRMLLRRGPDNIVAAWIASMIVRMFGTLIGLVLLLTRYRVDRATCVWTVCGMYLVLLAVETVGMIGLMRSEFERQSNEKSNERRLKDER